MVGMSLNDGANILVVSDGDSSTRFAEKYGTELPWGFGCVRWDQVRSDGYQGTRSGRHF